MKKQSFHFEVENLLTQFIDALDGAVINRYDGGRNIHDRIKIRYVYSPKQRVLYDIINAGKNFSTPVIALSINNISRDPSRVFNKIDGFILPQTISDSAGSRHSKYFRMPVPINVSVDVTIICKNITDLEQILSNFSAYTNPYIVIKWKVPTEFGLANDYEIRTEVEWSGEIKSTFLTEQEATTKYKVVGDTSFIIKGWIFPAADEENIKNIYFIDANFHSYRHLSGGRYPLYTTYDDYHVLSGDDGYDTESIHLSGNPQITDFFYSSVYEIGIGNPILENFTVNDSNRDGEFTILGRNFQWTTAVLISGANIGYGPLTAVSFEYYPTISGYIIPLSSYTINSENAITVHLPLLSGSGIFDIIPINIIGWDSSYSAYSTHVVTVTSTGEVSNVITTIESGESSSSTGVLIFTGSMITIEAGESTASSGVLVFAGTLTTTESAEYTTSNGSLIFTGSLVTTESAEYTASTGSLIFTGTLTTTESAEYTVAEGTQSSLCPYEIWAATWPLTGALSAENSDYDLDSITNVEEWAFDTDPTYPFTGAITFSSGTITQHGVPTLYISGGANLVWGRRLDYASLGLTYTPEFSPNNITWTPSAATPTGVANDATLSAVYVPFPPGTFFGRVTVTYTCP